ncbi:aspartate/glutamate racemase family protein [Candidatus Saccharibacteria bacterium]|nr:aspartate/glutamate racemase family protein [Candidatus Saccharibacteria bacterium]
MKQIVVFDTGTGGKIFADHFRQEIPGVKITEVIDSINAPYGSKKPAQILTLTESALRPYLNDPLLPIIVLACNTATALTLSNLRSKYPNQIFVGTEPAVKPAAQLTRNGKVLILATPAALRSPHYQNLKSKYAKKLTLYEPNCTDWAAKIDAGTLTDQDISATLSPYQAYSPDVIILACTHYLAIPTQAFTNIFPDISIYSPLPSVTNRIKSLLRQL